MTNSVDPLSLAQIIAAATECLIGSGFTQASSTTLPGIDSSRHRVFEDAYSVVAILVVDKWSDLRDGWIEAQSALVELMSDFVPKDAPKSWDGYLVLFTPGLVSLADKSAVARIRYDTGRVRKLIVTGEQLKEVADVENALLPLLPLNIEFGSAPSDEVLSRLPELLANEALKRETIQAVVDAHITQEPLVEALHTSLWGPK